LCNLFAQFPLNYSHMAVVKKMIPDEKKKLVPWLEETRNLEKEDKEMAVKEYKRIASAYPLSEQVYDRLMILFRQLKMPKEEMFWIDKAIGVFENKFGKNAARPKAKVVTISKSIIRSLGLSDKKGRLLYQPQPIARWEKRKHLLQKKLS
jgi:hypothetical protein